MITNRYQGLDVLRGIAVLAVVLYHTNKPWADWGWLGVDLFFVLSGFLVSGLLFAEHKKTGTIRPWRFLIRRGFKIYPTFYLFLAVTPLLKKAPINAYLVEVFYGQSYLDHIWGHTWSLAVEEHFYLMLVVILWLLRKQGYARLPIVLVPIIIAVLMFRTATWFRWSCSLYTMHPTHCRIDSLLIGVLTAWLWAYHKDGVRPMIGWPMAVLSMPYLLPALAGATENGRLQTYGLTSIAIAFAIWVLVAVKANGHWTLEPLAMIGRWSYGIYIWHMPIMAYAPSANGIAGAIMVGWLSTMLVERPCLRLRERWAE